MCADLSTDFMSCADRTLSYNEGNASVTNINIVVVSLPTQTSRTPKSVCRLSRPVDSRVKV